MMNQARIHCLQKLCQDKGQVPMSALNDIYASRGNREATTVLRDDPVVYADKPEVCPVAHELIEEYAENGFIVVDGLFDADEIDLWQHESARIRVRTETPSECEVITEPGSSEIRSIFKIHSHSAVFSDLAADERLAGLARYILNDDVYLHQSRLNYKPGLRGKEFYWHSDFETWHMEDGMPRMRALSMSIALTENFLHNGPVMLVPGSHREYLTCPGETPTDHYKQSLQKQEYGVPTDDSLHGLIDRYGISIVTGRPGSVLIFDCNTMHGSAGNITPYPRSNVFYVYNAWSNRLQAPWSGQTPRPEHIAGRNDINIIPAGIRP